MKKTAIILGLLLFCAQTVLADEVSTEQTAKDNRTVIVVQKQPAKDNKQEVKNNWFCIILQSNGEINKNNPANSDNQ